LAGGGSMNREEFLNLPNQLRLAAYYIESHARPFSYIKELESIVSIKTFEEVTKINDFVYSYVPWMEKPFILTDRFGQCDNETIVDYLYTHFKLPAFIGGWCGLSTDFFMRIMWGYGVECHPYNFGIANTRYTHVGALVKLSGDDYYFDPYFGKFFIWNNGTPITFLELKELIKIKELHRVSLIYANKFKPVYFRDGLLYMDPVEFEKMVIADLNTLGLKEALLKLFGDTEFMNLFLIPVQ